MRPDIKLSARVCSIEISRPFPATIHRYKSSKCHAGKSRKRKKTGEAMVQLRNASRMPKDLPQKAPVLFAEQIAQIMLEEKAQKVALVVPKNEIVDNYVFGELREARTCV